MSHVITRIREEERIKDQCYSTHDMGLYFWKTATVPILKWNSIIYLASPPLFGFTDMSCLWVCRFLLYICHQKVILMAYISYIDLIDVGPKNKKIQLIVYKNLQSLWSNCGNSLHIRQSTNWLKCFWKQQVVLWHYITVTLNSSWL